MASLFFSTAHGKWRCKWHARLPDGSRRWETVTLCEHPGWKRPAEGKEAKKPTKPPPDAERLFHKYKEKEMDANAGVAISEGRSVQIRAFLAQAVTAAEGSHTKGSRAVMKRAFDEFADYCAAKDVLTVQAVTSELCRGFLAHMLAKKQKRSTVKTARAYLSPPWEQAVRDGHLMMNPWRGAPLAGKDRQERPPFWTEAEILKLRTAADPALSDIIAVGFGTGIRISAMLGLRWSDVEFHKGTIHVRASESKSGRYYDAPMIGAARDVLERKAAIEDTSGLVFRQRNGKPYLISTTYEQIGRLVKAAGVEDRKHYNHILRHSFATWAVAKGVPLKVVSGWLGHSSIAMTEKYAHADPSAMRQWAEFLSRPSGETESRLAKNQSESDGG